MTNFEKSIRIHALWIVPLLFFGSFYAILKFRPFEDKRAKNFQIFYKTSLNGRLGYISSSGSLTFIKLVGDSVKYEFLPRTEFEKDNIWFNYVARLNDSISKPADSDTLYLLKKEKTYYFTFKKY